ncbi:co-chaperone GroES [Candidatus Acetothermia bacterium]|jgi:chaperonin GroES|nr:co-chaperone GroES [Candidatus Bipolaricaulota bacterium]RLE39679.1 MAG: co-chaperone GroES [Candidatus Acetothermia bacterium]RLE41036.1 MAG: co-chaperone GroES [Candidatus Acetothermia bacterium]HDJ30146.1 co-chaperone GroES [Candidatus Acetothermia bacterium]
MKIKPLGNRILAKKIEEEERRTPGGIVLPESAKSDKVVRAKVIAVGSNEKIEVKEGDEIIVSSFAGTEVEMGEDKLLLVKATDVLAVIEE